MKMWTLCSMLALVACAHTGPAPVPTSGVENAAGLAEAGHAAEAQGDSVRAEQYYAASIAAGGDARSLTVDLVRVAIRGGRLRSALAHAEPELMRHPGDAALAQLVGGLYFALGELGRAEAALTQALSADEGSALAHYTLALVLAKSRTRDEEVRAHLTRYVALEPRGPHRARAEYLLGPAR